MKTKVLSILLLGWLCYSCTQSSPKQYRSMDDVRQGTIGVLMGSAQDAYITETFTEAKVLRIDMSTDLATALNAGTCDVAVFDNIEASALLKAYPNFAILEEKLKEHPLGVGFRQDEKTMSNAFNTFLAQIKANGIYDEMQKRWISPASKETIEMPAISLPQKGEPLRIGTTGTSIPYSFVKNGKKVGFDIELITRFAAVLGRPVEFQMMNFGGLIPALQSGKVEVIINSIMITPERSQKVNFSQPYTYSVAQVLTKKSAMAKSPNFKFKSKEEMKDKRIAVLMGTVHDKFVTANFPQAAVIRSETYADMLMTLAMHKCEALVLNKVTYTSMHKSNSEVVLLDSTMYFEDVGMGFSYQQNGLKEQYNTFLKKIRQNKVYDGMIHRWTTEGENAEMPAIPQATTGLPIRIGVTGSNIPFTFVRNGQHVGLDIELLMRFAQSIHRPIQFLTINFGGLISALSSGKVDVISAALVITPERAKNVNFADPYFQCIGVMAVLNENLETSGLHPTTVGKSGFFARVGEGFYNNIIAEKRYLLILDGLGVTLLISLGAILLGTLFGAFICFLRMNRQPVLSLTGKAYINLMRGIPVLVLLMLMYYVVFASWDINATLVAMIAFAMNFAAYVSEMFRTSIEGVDRGQSEAGIALGFTRLQTFRYIVMPQAIKTVLPVYKGELISLIKMTSVVGYIAVSDLTKVSDIIRSRTFDAFFPLIMVAVLYILLSWLFAIALDSLNNAKFTRK
ncbi:MAG: ABC transporter permease subunit [Bacteroides sp.]